MPANCFQVVVCGLLVAGLVSCNQPSSGGSADGAASVSQGSGTGRTRFVSATVTRKFDGSGRLTNDRLNVSDPQQLAALESYFRQAGRGERGPLAGGWVPSVIITFKPTLGREVKIHTNYEVWSEGLGDWPAKDGLKSQIERMFDHKTIAAAG